MRMILLVMFLGCLLGPGRVAWTSEQPRVLEVAVPGYPRMPSGARDEGEISVEVEIARDGHVLSAKATAGPLHLRVFAENAARRWRFESSDTESASALLVFAFVLQRHLGDPPIVTATFKAPNRVEVVTERREIVILADPPMVKLEAEEKKR